jgi:hypothetical protein
VCTVGKLCSIREKRSKDSLKRVQSVFERHFCAKDIDVRLFHRMPYTSINGTGLFYTLIGQGEPSLVMHGGMGSDQTMVHPRLDLLEHVFPLVYYDHRGNGRSGRLPIETLMWEQLAHDTVGLIPHHS